LEHHFQDVAKLRFDWLWELLDIGCSYEEMARLLIDGENASPWISIDSPILVSSIPTPGFHQELCVHSGGKRMDTTARIVSAHSKRIEQMLSYSPLPVKETVSELCGIAGILPKIYEDPDL
jgi:hypothetical protein